MRSQPQWKNDKYIMSTISIENIKQQNLAVKLDIDTPSISNVVQINEDALIYDKKLLVYEPILSNFWIRSLYSSDAAIFTCDYFMMWQ